MQAQTIQITQLSPEQFEETINKAVRSQIEILRRDISPKSEPIVYLTRKEVSDLLKIQLSTLHSWVKKGKLKPYGIGNRVYFKKSEIEEALRPLHS
jgi:excisionase family DNA binding protein